MTVYNFIIPEEYNNLRIDKAISNFLPESSRTVIQRAIKNANVLVQKQIIDDPSYKVKINDEICINLNLQNSMPDSSLKPVAMNLDIIYEDEDLIVINKPSGLTVHPGNGVYSDTLVNGLMYHTNDLSDINSDVRPGIVHRLDKETSGLMVVAKNNFSHQRLAEQIFNRSLIRKYKALIFGVMQPFSGKIETNIARSKTDRTKMCALKKNSPNGKIAITYYTTELILAKGIASLVECKLDTGRTHQIRVHLSHMQHSIIGDQIYGNNNRKVNSVVKLEVRNALMQLRSQALHSFYLAFRHPVSNKVLEFSSQLPTEMQKVISDLSDM
jgi:23S rRNA pseudouridine1911/1915/1917 synthase